MDIEELSKSQLLMLTLLVNFITSIAAGILTVSLLAQAPTTVTQTVNRIVDHTIETVATGTPLSTIIAPPTTTVTKTIIQHDDSQLPDAIASVAARTVSIYSSAGTSTPLIAHATYLASARAIVTPTQSTGLPDHISVVFPDGTVLPASISRSGATLTIYGFSDTAVLPKAPSATIIAHVNVKQGVTVVALTADNSAVTGIVSKVDADTIHTNLPYIPAGSAIMNVSGDILGISTGAAGVYIVADKITTLLNATPATSGS